MLPTSVASAILLSMLCLQVAAQEKVIRLYAGPAPGSADCNQTEQENRTKLWQTRVVFNVANPTLQDWIKAGKSAELHLYSKGGHGFGMRTQNLPSDHWIELFTNWLDVQGLMKKS